MIYFKSITWRNFLSTGNIPHTIQLDKAQSTLIVGENGAGKSTLLDALCFALYGKPYRNINKPQLINAINQKQMLVELDFSIGSKSYRIVRGMKPNIFDVYVDGKLLNQDAAARDYQEVLEKQILQLNFRSFCQVVILGSASFVPFMQLPAQHRREVVEDLLDIDIFSKMNVLHKSNVANLDKELSDNEYSLRLVNERINMSQVHAQELKDNTQELIDAKRLQINGLNEQVRTIEEQTATLASKIGDLEKQNENGPDLAKKLSKYNKLKVQIKTKIANLERDKAFFHDTEVCPTCRQEIADGFKAEQVTHYDGELATVRDGLTKLDEEIAKLDTALAEVNARQKTINELVIEQNGLNRDKRNVLATINAYEGEISALQAKMMETKSEENIIALESERDSIIEAKKGLVTTADMHRLATVILKDSGIKSKIIKQYVPVINKLINKYLASMEFFVNFELDETFKETIKSRFRDDFTYASFSEGEKMRINLAILFTWRAIAKMRNSASTNLLIMDEVFDSSLDSSGTEEFMKIITGLTSDTNTFIISHKTEQLTDRFEEIIRFEKHKNFSRMV